MIFDMVLGYAIGVVGALVALLPTMAPLDLGSMSAFVGIMRNVNDAFPVDTVFAAAGLYVTALAFAAAFGGIRMILRFLPSWLTGGG